MKETGIIMSGNHPKLILDGIKTQTRRVVNFGRFFSNNEHFKNNYKFEKMFYDDHKDENVAIFGYKPEGDKYGFSEWFKCSYGQVGDKLWVRETWATDKLLDYLPPRLLEGAGTLPFWYLADSDQHSIIQQGKWRPSIFMPRWASRITLEITEVRVERVQEITEEDAEKEGVSWSSVSSGENPEIISAVENFATLWDSLNAKRGYGWEVNPWVWVISFRRINNVHNSQ